MSCPEPTETYTASARFGNRERLGQEPHVRTDTAVLVAINLREPDRATGFAP